MATPKKEHPYKKAPRVEKVIANLAENFGYGRLESRVLATEVCDNLDRHVALVESTIKRLSSVGQPTPTQTPYWRAHNG
jgi:hypothetical protein